MVGYLAARHAPKGTSVGSTCRETWRLIMAPFLDVGAVARSRAPGASLLRCVGGWALPIVLEDLDHRGQQAKADGGVKRAEAQHAKGDEPILADGALAEFAR